MPRASPSAKRQPGAANQRDIRNESGVGSHGKRAARLQQKSAHGSSSPGCNAVARPSSSAGNLAPTATPSSPASTLAVGTPSPPPLLAAAAAAAAAANGCTRDADTMASSSSSPAYHSQQRHRNSDSAASAAAGTRRSHTADRHQLALDNVSLASSTDSLAVSHVAIAASGTAGASSSPAVSFDDSHRRIDVNAAKNASVHRDTGPLDLAMTILRSCPLYDTIAILIILMQLSPVVLSIVYMLFTVLTFVPPVTTSSGLSLTEMFEGGLGTPAFTTIVCMDVGILLVWLFLWGPLQLLILDFAQVVIALTLGGGCNGNGSRQGSANNIFVCLGIIIFSHFSHVPSLEKVPHLGPLFAADHSSVFAEHHISLQQSSRFFSRRAGGASWVRNIFAIHILMQGIVRYIREWYLRRERRDSLANSLADPEAGKGTYTVETPMEATFSSTTDNDGHTSTTGNTAGTEPSSHVTSSSTTGSSSSTVPASSPVSGPTDADTGSTVGTGSNVSGVSPATGHISTKKKKKQSALVRLRQPLWAALASTKIVMIKEYELSQAASESAGAEATDVDNLGNAPFYAQPGQIWMCYVGHDEVCFSTSVFPNEDLDQKHSSASPPPSSSFIDTTKPFYVRINNATWQPTRIIPVADGGDEEPAISSTAEAESDQSSPSTGTHWTGDIYGLTPLSSYECEFVSTRTGEVLFSTSVRTAAAPSKSAAVAAAKPAPPSQLRPHESPATTIKASIATQEAKLNDEKTRVKALRRDNNRRANTLKKEIDRLAASVQSAGGNDDKFKQKITQNTVQQKQAEQAIESIEAELKEVNTVPEEVLSQYRNRKSEWDRERAQFDGAVASFKSFKSAVDNEIRSLEDELATFQAKRNKIASRIAKADSEHAQIMDANARGLDEAERRRQERVNIETEISRSHQGYIERLAAVQNANEEKVHTIESLHETMRSFYSSFDSERPYENRYAFGSAPAVPATSAVPTSAPGAWPTPHMPTGTLYVPSSLWAPVPTLSTSGPSPIASHITPATPYMHIQQLQANPMPPVLRMRGRSSSMLSDVSGFTQSSTADDDITAPVGGTGGSTSQTVGVFSSYNLPSGQASQAGTIRGPSGFGFTRDRGSSGSGSGSNSGSGSGSASSVRSGSGSAGSVRDPASPL